MGRFETGWVLRSAEVQSTLIASYIKNPLMLDQTDNLNY